jgi:hypothetical protein
MTNYTLRDDKISVPVNTGVEGFLHTVRRILHLPRVQSVHIDSKGVVSYSRYVQEGERAEPLGVAFDELLPSYIIQHSEVRDLPFKPRRGAATLVSQLFEAVAQERLQPVAFVGGADTQLWDWFCKSTGLSVRRDSFFFFGLPVFLDRFYEDDLLLLCGAYTRESGLADTQVAFKVFMEDNAVPATEVDVL